LIQFSRLPSGQKLPLAYRCVRSHGLTGLTPWHFYDDESDARAWRKTYRRNNFLLKDAWPFAWHQGRLEVAAFPLRCGMTNGKVVVVDCDFLDTNMGGRSYKVIETYPSFFAWLRDVIEETEERMSEEDLAQILDE
jgi:hypothetical protein